jgi:hypothetical protein
MKSYTGSHSFAEDSLMVVFLKLTSKNTHQTPFPLFQKKEDSQYKTEQSKHGRAQQSNGGQKFGHAVVFLNQ